jgi:REP element-mobilizing transposase RayT
MFSAWPIVLQIGVSQTFENDDRCGTAIADCYLALTLNMLPLCHQLDFIHCLIKIQHHKTLRQILKNVTNFVVQILLKNLFMTE